MNPIDDRKTIKTPTGEHEIVMRTFLTGADKRSNRRLILSLTKDNAPGADAIEAAENALLTQVIISIDGDEDKEKIVATVVAMKVEDYDFLIDAVNEVAGGSDKKKERT